MVNIIFEQLQRTELTLILSGTRMYLTEMPCCRRCPKRENLKRFYFRRFFNFPQLDFKHLFLYNSVQFCIDLWTWQSIASYSRWQVTSVNVTESHCNIIVPGDHGPERVLPGRSCQDIWPPEATHSQFCTEMQNSVQFCTIGEHTF